MFELQNGRKKMIYPCINGLCFNWMIPNELHGNLLFNQFHPFKTGGLELQDMDCLVATCQKDFLGVGNLFCQPRFCEENLKITSP